VNRTFNKYIIICKYLIILLLNSVLICEEIIYDFSGKTNLENWYVVDDDVMGGRSNGKLFLEDGNVGVFTGYISLKNYGGFSSIRYDVGEYFINDNNYIIIIVKGDNKYYQIRVRSSYYDRYVYTKKVFVKDEWQEISISLESLEPFFRGNRLRRKNFNKNKICEIGFLIGNKIEENFKLKIKSISLNK